MPLMRAPRLPPIALLALAACSSRSSPAPSASATAAITAEPAITAAPSASPSASTTAGAAAKPAKPPSPPSFAGAQLEWRSDGQRLFIIAGKKSMIVPVPSGPAIELPESPEAITTASFSKDGAILAVGHDKAITILFDAGSGKRIAELRGEGESPSDVHAIVFSKDGAQVAIAGARVELWEVASRKRVCAVDSSYMWSLAFAPDGKWFAGTGSHQYAAWSTQKCAKLEEGDLETGGTFPSTISEDAAFVASAEGAGHALRVYSTRPFKRRANLPGASSCQDHVGGIRFSPSGALVSSGGGHWIRTYEPKTLRPRASWKAAPKPPPALYTVFHDGIRFAHVPEVGPITIVDMRSKKTLAEMVVEQLATLDVAPDDAHIATVTDQVITIWDTKTGKEVRSVKPVRP